MFERPYDIIVWGATGFTGRFVALYLAESAPSQVSWAIAGRSRQKLKVIAEEIQTKFSKEIDILEADAHDLTSLDALVMKTRVIISTVGPFAKYGEPLVDACVRMKTHYIDSTGESLFVKRMIQKHHHQAEKDGTFIVSCCGFDCVPADLGAYLAAYQMKKKFNEKLGKVTFSVYDAQGGVSGGTINSVLNLLEQPLSVLASLQDPFHLMSNNNEKPNDPKPEKAPKRKFVEYIDSLKKYDALHVMEQIDTAIVHRSYSLLNGVYGAKFHYTEGITFSSYYKAWLFSFTFSLSTILLTFSGFRWLIKKFGPQPGQGPSQEQLEKGYFKILVSAESQCGTNRTDGSDLPKNQVLLDIVSKRDGGYVETGKMLSESALCFILESDRIGKHPAWTSNSQDKDKMLTIKGGVVTPAAAFGMALVDRLNAADLKFTFRN